MHDVISRSVAHMLRPIFVCWFVFALLTLTLDAQSIWWDEGISLHLASISWREVVQDRAANIHPPLYFFALKLWTGAVGRSPFAARYLSTLALTLLPAAVYAFVSRRVNRHAGRVAALLVALSPPFFMYGQEVRAYAFLPLLALALLAYVWPPKDAPASPRGVHTLLLALVQLSLVLMHYTGIVAVAWANLAFLVRSLASGDRRLWWRWLLAGALVALLVLPWGLAVLNARSLGFRGDAGLSNTLDEPLPADYFVRLIAIFQAVGLPTAMVDPLLFRPAILVGLLLVVCLAYALLRRGKERGPVIKLLLAWLLPMTAAPAIWTLSSQAHPRYLLPFVLLGWLLVAVLAAARSVPRLLRGALLTSLLVMSLLGLRAYLSDPDYARSDVRAAATYLRLVAQPGDAVLVPFTDWSLEQYPLGEAEPVMLPPVSSDAAVAQALSRVARPGRQIYALDYGRVALDPRGQVRTTLEWGGYLVARQSFNGVYLQHYAVHATPVISLTATEDALPACVEASSPCLTGAAFESHPESGAALPLLLYWEGTAPARYAVGLRLYAPSGALVAATDALLLNAAMRPSDGWGGAPLVTYHLLPLPVGLPPRSYRVEVGVYDTVAPDVPLSLVRAGAPPAPHWVLGYVTPTVEPALPVSVYGLADGPSGPESFAPPGPVLLGAALDRYLAYAGQPLYVTLRWRMGSEALVPAAVLQLRRGERVLSEVPALADLPELPEGRIVLEHLALSAPPDAADGEASIVLVAGEDAVTLGRVELSIGTHTFVVPSIAHPQTARAGDMATLLGYDLAPEAPLRSGQPLTVTLYWQAETSVTDDWTVFVHLLDQDGRIVAQHDGKPAGGTRAIPSWLSGEIVTDAHVLTWAHDYAGQASLLVGFYDASTGVRLLWEEGRDAWTLDTEMPVTFP